MFICKILYATRPQWKNYWKQIIKARHACQAHIWCQHRNKRKREIMKKNEKKVWQSRWTVVNNNRRLWGHSHIRQNKNERPPSMSFSFKIVICYVIDDVFHTQWTSKDNKVSWEHSTCFHVVIFNVKKRIYTFKMKCRI